MIVQRFRSSSAPVAFSLRPSDPRARVQVDQEDFKGEHRQAGFFSGERHEEEFGIASCVAVFLE